MLHPMHVEHPKVRPKLATRFPQLPVQDCMFTRSRSWPHRRITLESPVLHMRSPGRMGQAEGGGRARCTIVASE